ncbi:hypothetical protein MMC09_001196 [Bachmanniomyces sp. S44760]|nr:hypothetical protein [Bachmanniomyces sp. S44760]
MNNQPLPTSHGFPVRIITPGVAGARSVKWLDRITVQTEESQNHYQQRDYKVLPPEATDKEAAARYWDVTPAMQDMPINSVIVNPQSGETVRRSGDHDDGDDGTVDVAVEVEVEGYALPGGESGPVLRVELSVDDGKTWTQAEHLEGSEGKGKWCWVLWKGKVRFEKLEGAAEKKKKRILSRAIDKGGNIQDGNAKWNLRGVGYNGYGESRDLTVV